jgi:hypothetical protein
LRREDLIDRRPIRDLLDKNGRVLVPAFQKIDRDHARRAESLGLERLEVVKTNRYIEATLAMDNTHGEQDALLDIYRKIRPGDPATQEGAKQLIRSLYYDLRRYDLARVGRYKINKKLELNIPLDVRALTREDLIHIVKYIIRLSEGFGTVDDIDHLENKRVRSMGELLQNQLRMGFLHGESCQRAHDQYGPGERQSAGGFVYQADLRQHKKLLRLQPAVSVHGPAQPAGRTYPQAVAFSAWPRRAFVPERQAGGPRCSPFALRPNLPN